MSKWQTSSIKGPAGCMWGQVGQGVLRSPAWKSKGSLARGLRPAASSTPRVLSVGSYSTRTLPPCLSPARENRTQAELATLASPLLHLYKTSPPHAGP